MRPASPPWRRRREPSYRRQRAPAASTASSRQARLDPAGDLEQALLEEHRRFANIRQGLAALFEDAPVPGELAFERAAVLGGLRTGRVLDRADPVALVPNPVGEAALAAGIALDAVQDAIALGVDQLEHARENAREALRFVWRGVLGEGVDQLIRLLEAGAARGELLGKRRRLEVLAPLAGAGGIGPAPHGAGADRRHLALDARPIRVRSRLRLGDGRGREERRSGQDKGEFRRHRASSFGPPRRAIVPWPGS